MSTEEKEKINIGAGLTAVARHLVPYKKEITRLSILGFISALANGVVPYVTGRFLDALIALTGGDAAPVAATWPLWMILLGIWACVQFVANSVDWVLDRKRRFLDTSVHLGIQARGFMHLIRLPLAFHKNERIDEVLQRLSNAGWRITSIVRTTVNVAPELLSVLIGVVLAASINGMLAGVLGIGVLVYCLLLWRMLIPVAAKDEEAHRLWNDGWGDASAAIHQVETVKHAAAEEHEINKTKEAMMGKAVRAWQHLDMIWSNVSFFQRMIVFLTQLAVFVLSVHYIRIGEITVGELVALNGYAAMFFGPFVQLGYSWQTMQNGLTAAVHAEKIFTALPEDYKEGTGHNHDFFTGAVSFTGVGFSYGPEQPEVLSDINFSVSPGDVVALVGASGVGKSTAINLISGYYFPTAGVVTIDGVPTSDWDLTALRKHIAIVPQEVALFNDTIRENIRYGTFEASDADIERVAAEAHIADFIAGLPKGYDTLVGERGLKLSVGQKQRVAIARAFLRDPAILILDEPTSALDARTEQFITASFEKLMKGRTTFIIAHRLSTVRAADKILVFENGKVVETGTHNELVKKTNGVYRGLHEYQAGTITREKVKTPRKKKDPKSDT